MEEMAIKNSDGSYQGAVIIGYTIEWCAVKHKDKLEALSDAKDLVDKLNKGEE